MKSRQRLVQITAMQIGYKRIPLEKERKKYFFAKGYSLNIPYQNSQG
jgi:hypothetical protein